MADAFGEVANLDTVDAGIVQESAHPLDPPRTAADVALEPQRLRQAETESGRQLDLAALRAIPVHTCPQLEGGVVAASQVGRGGESVEVLDREVGHRHAGQQPARLAPVVTLECRPSVVDRSPHHASIADAAPPATRPRSGAVRCGWPRRWFC